MRAESKGFTLIELLIVIAIIGILSATVLVALNTARGKARDVRRLQDITQIQRALELYYQDNGQYPTACGGTLNAWKTNGSHASYVCTTGSFIDDLGSYMATLPSDPSSAVYGYMYRVSSDRQDYKIMAWNSVEQNMAPFGTPNSRCGPSCTSSACLAYTNNYAKYSEGAACW